MEHISITNIQYMVFLLLTTVSSILCVSIGNKNLYPFKNFLRLRFLFG